MDMQTKNEITGKCPFNHIAGVGRTNRDWWPNQLRLELLHQHSSKSDPMGKGFNYAKAFKKLDYKAQCAGTSGSIAKHCNAVDGLFGPNPPEPWPWLVYT